MAKDLVYLVKYKTYSIYIRNIFSMTFPQYFNIPSYTNDGVADEKLIATGTFTSTCKNLSQKYIDHHNDDGNFNKMNTDMIPYYDSKEKANPMVSWRGGVS